MRVEMKKGWTDGTFGASAKRAVHRVCGFEGQDHRNSRHIACPDKEMRRCSGWQAQWDKLTCHLLQRELLEPWGGVTGRTKRTQDAYGDDHPREEKRDVERRAGHGCGQGRVTSLLKREMCHM